MNLKPEPLSFSSTKESGNSALVNLSITVEWIFSLSQIKMGAWGKPLFWTTRNVGDTHVGLR